MYHCESNVIIVIQSLLLGVELLQCLCYSEEVPGCMRQIMGLGHDSTSEKKWSHRRGRRGYVRVSTSAFGSLGHWGTRFMHHVMFDVMEDCNEVGRQRLGLGNLNR